MELTQDGEDGVLFGLSAYLIGAVNLQEMEVKNMLLESWTWMNLRRKYLGDIWIERREMAETGTIKKS